MRHSFRLVSVIVAVGLAGASAWAQSASAPSSVDVRDIVFRWTATDGTPLDGKLSLPAGAKQRVPVVFLLHGAGPSNYDHAVRYRGADGQIQSTRYYDFHARELARLGLGFFRMSKRGVTGDAAGRAVVERSIFSKATPTVLLDDYARGLEALRQRSEIDPNRIALFGASEGTRLAPQLALRSPVGIVGLVLTSHQSDNQHGTVVWQNTVGVWRAVEKLIPTASDGSLTKAEYDEALKGDATLAARLPFAAIDTDANGDQARAPEA
jgi:predicted esterase